MPPLIHQPLVQHILQCATAIRHIAKGVPLKRRIHPCRAAASARGSDDNKVIHCVAHRYRICWLGMPAAHRAHVYLGVASSSGFLPHVKISILMCTRDDVQANRLAEPPYPLVLSQAVVSCRCKATLVADLPILEEPDKRVVIVLPVLLGKLSC